MKALLLRNVKEQPATQSHIGKQLKHQYHRLFNMKEEFLTYRSIKSAVQIACHYNINQNIQHVVGIFLLE